MKSFIERHPLSVFFVLAYACSWIVAVPLALQAQGIVPTRLPLALHYATAYGPAIAALVVRRTLDSHSRARARRRDDPKPTRWVPFAFAAPLLLFGGSQLVARMVGQRAPSWVELGEVNFLPALGLAAWLLWFLTSGIGEELGWRGFAVPHLQRTHSALTTSVLVAIAWAGWHLPAFFYVPSYAAMGLAMVPGFFLGILAGSIVLTWLYNRSGGSVLAVALWHASFNFVTASLNAGGLVAAVTSMAVVVWALAVVWRSAVRGFPSRRVVAPAALRVRWWRRVAHRHG